MHLFILLSLHIARFSQSYSGIMVGPPDDRANHE